MVYEMQNIFNCRVNTEKNVFIYFKIKRIFIRDDEYGSLSSLLCSFVVLISCVHGHFTKRAIKSKNSL